MPLNIVIQTAFLGDLLLSIPLLKEMKRQWPDHRLGLVCRKGMGDIFVRMGLVDELFEIEKGNRRAYKEVISRLNERGVNQLVSPHQSMRTVLFVAQIKARHKIGFKSFSARWVYSETIIRDLRLPDALRQLSLLRGLDASLAERLRDYAANEQPSQLDNAHRLPKVPEWGSMGMRAHFYEANEIFLNLKEKFQLRGFAENILGDSQERAVLLFPGSVWATKRWTEEGFIQCGQELQAQGYHVYVMGGPGEEELSQRIAQAIGCPSLAGQTKIYESAHLIARAALVIGNDSASTHLASVTETPLIAVFGPTVLEFGYRPWSSQAAIEQVSLHCRPCGKHGHHVCPLGTHDCMKLVKAESVLKTAHSQLNPPLCNPSR